MLFEFGSGALVGISNDPTIVTPTPREFGVLQGVSLDFTATTKQLFGTYQFPVAVARGTAKISGKATFARIYGAIYNELFFNGTLATGQTVMEADEPHTIASHSVTVTNVTGWVDLGVKGADGKYLTKVASAPADGQYSAAAGVYTFSATDAVNANGAIVKIIYTWTRATGSTLTITNPILGAVPSFQIHLRQRYLQNNLYVKLNQVMSSKLAIATKLEDFTIPEMDFEAFADSSNNIGLVSTDE